tara:strand:- start:118 stop:387 length:270 start_codon:yes stop_codon:yes gene_type:complete
MSIWVTIYENITNYVSDRFRLDTPYQSQRVIPLVMQTQEESVLTRLYEQMEKGHLIPYYLFPNKNKNTSPCSPTCVALLPNVNTVDLGV